MTLLELGRICGTHGIRGELRVYPYADSAEFLCGFEEIYLDGQPCRVVSSRVHGGVALMRLEGVGDKSAAELLRGKIMKIDPAKAVLPQGRSFVAELIGMAVLDGTERVGVLTEVLKNPAHDIFVVRGDDGIEHMIPVVDAFVRGIDKESGTIQVSMIEGL